MKTEYSGEISCGTYFVSDTQDLRRLVDFVRSTYGDKVAKEIEEDHPEVFTRSYQVNLTQEEVDILHVLLGYVVNKEALKIDEKISEMVSNGSYENYDRVSFTVCSEDGLSIKID